MNKLPGLSRRLLLGAGVSAGISTAISLPAAAATLGKASRRRRREVAYVCNSYGDSISIIDVAAGRVIETIRFDYGTKREIDRWPSGKVTVANTPMNAKLTPDGRQLWVPNTSGMHLAVIEVGSNRILDKIDTTYGPCDISFTPDGKTAVFSLLDQGAAPGFLGIIDVASRQIRRVAVGKRPEECSLSPDGKLAFSHGLSRSLTVVDVQRAQVVREVPIPALGYDSVFSPDGRLLYITSFGTPGMVVVRYSPDPNKIEVLPSIDVDVPSNVAFSPDGRLMYVSSTVKDSLTVLDARTHKTLNVIKLPEKPSHIGITSRGDTAYIGHSGSNAVTVVDLRAMKVTGAIPTGEGPSSITMGWL